MYIMCIVLCILYPAYSIQQMYTYCIQIELYTFSTYVQMAPPRLEQQQHVRLHALRGQGCHYLMLVS
jgi:hypothetical protein